MAKGRPLGETRQTGMVRLAFVGAGQMAEALAKVRTTDQDEARAARKLTTSFPTTRPRLRRGSSPRKSCQART